MEREVLIGSLLFMFVVGWLVGILFRSVTTFFDRL